jgi:hypothetical protein
MLSDLTAQIRSTRQALFKILTRATCPPRVGLRREIAQLAENAIHLVDAIERATLAVDVPDVGGASLPDATGDDDTWPGPSYHVCGAPLLDGATIAARCIIQRGVPHTHPHGARDAILRGYAISEAAWQFRRHDVRAGAA